VPRLSLMQTNQKKDKTIIIIVKITRICRNKNNCEIIKMDGAADMDKIIKIIRTIVEGIYRVTLETITIIIRTIIIRMDIIIGMIAGIYLRSRKNQLLISFSEIQADSQEWVAEDLFVPTKEEKVAVEEGRLADFIQDARFSNIVCQKGWQGRVKVKTVRMTQMLKVIQTISFLKMNRMKDIRI
jgi:hypothetical protein